MTELREYTASSNGESQAIARTNTAILHSGDPAGFRAEGNPRELTCEADKQDSPTVQVESILALANKDAVRKTAQVGQFKQSIARTIDERGMIDPGLAKSLTRTLADLL